MGVAVPKRLEEAPGHSRHVHKGCTLSQNLFINFVNFLMLYSEAEVPTVAGMNGKVTAYGKSGGFLESLIFSFSQRPLN